MQGEHLVDRKQPQQEQPLLFAGQQPPVNFKSRAGVGWLGGFEVYA